MYANDATSAVSGKAFLLTVRAELEGIILPYVTNCKKMRLLNLILGDPGAVSGGRNL